jgi:GMP synthase PP-ATPase subunit
MTADFYRLETVLFDRSATRIVNESGVKRVLDDVTSKPSGSSGGSKPSIMQFS